MRLDRALKSDSIGKKRNLILNLSPKRFGCRILKWRLCPAMVLFFSGPNGIKKLLEQHRKTFSVSSKS